MRRVNELIFSRAETRFDDEQEPVPGLVWLVGGATLLWALSYLIRLAA